MIGDLEIHRLCLSMAWPTSGSYPAPLARGLSVLSPTTPNPMCDLPREALDMSRRAEGCLARGEFSLASNMLERCLSLAPDHAGLLRRLAVALHMQERFREASEVLQRVLRSCPDDVTVYNSLGSALGAAGDMPGAVAALQRACEMAPERANYWYNLAKALEGTADAAGACTALTRFLELQPEDAEARILRAESFKIMGRIKEAEADLRHVLAQHPDSIEAWTPLVNLKSVRLSERDLAEIKRVHSRQGTREDYRTSLGFAYGQALEASGHYVEAFPIFVEANAAKCKHVQWDSARTSHFVDDTMKAFAQPLAQSMDVRRGHEVILLFGMPRSGSTLLEQILSAHSMVEGAGEISDLGVVLYEESVRRGADIPQWAPAATAEDWARLGDTYLERTWRWRQHRPIFTDKELGKWQILGAARAMLPGARFIDCRRDPLETCWSCFKHEFKTDQLYSYDIRWLAAYWHDYDRLMQFWQARYPGLVYKYAYEDLLERPETEIRRLLDYCGLPFDSACLRFHEVKRNVRTASAGQVRQPLNRNTAQSVHYGPLLNPLRQALGLPDSSLH